MKNLYFSAVLALLMCGHLHVAAQLTWYRDADKDYLGDPKSSVTAPTNPGGYVLNNFDCLDTQKTNLHWYEMDAVGVNGRVTDPFTYFGDIFFTFRDQTINGYTTVARYTTGSWILYSTNGMPVVTVLSNTFMSIDNTGTPYILCSFHTGELSIYKYNGTAWSKFTNILPPGSPKVWLVRFIIDNSNNCYVLVWGQQDTRLTLYKYNGSTATTVGAANFAGCYHAIANLAVSNSGTPYVSFADNTAGNRGSVMTFNGSSWAYVGSAGLTPGSIKATELAIDQSGAPYVSFNETSGSIIKKFSGGSWANVGNPASPVYPSGVTKFVISKSNTPLLLGGTQQAVYWYDDNAWHMSPFDTACNQIFKVVTFDANDLPVIVYSNSPDFWIVRVLRTTRYINAPDKPYLEAPIDLIHGGMPVTMRVNAGAKLNDASHWQWYKGTFDSTQPYFVGDTLTDYPTVTTKYFVRAEGGCAPSGEVDDKTITVFPVSVAATKAPGYLRLYPNPAKDLLHINNARGCNFVIIDAAGKELTQGNIVSDTFSINTGSYPRGLYFIRIRHSDGRQEIQKFAIN